MKNFRGGKKKDGNLEKVFAQIIGENEFSLCAVDGTVCIISDNQHSYLVDLVHRNSQLLKTVFQAPALMKVFRFQNDYFVLNKLGDQLEIDKINPSGIIGKELRIEHVDAFDLDGQELWYIQSGFLYRRSLISGLIQQVEAIEGNLVDHLSVTENFIVWHTIEGDSVLWNRKQETVENVWHNAQIFVEQKQILIVSEAKLWTVSDVEGIRFIGQAPSRIITVHPYTEYAWLASMANGDMLMIMTSPLGMYVIEEGTTAISTLPYQLIVKSEGKNLWYHSYPQKYWLKLLNV